MQNNAQSHTFPTPWDPAGSVPFKDWLVELQAWLNLTTGKMTMSAQASAIQLSMRGIARTFALALPPAAITHGAQINGIHTDPATYVLYCIANRFESLEDERSLKSGTQVLDFVAHPGEKIDHLLTRFDLARSEAETVGAGIDNFHTLTTILLRACRITGEQMIDLLSVNNGRLPVTQQQYDTIVM